MHPDLAPFQIKGATWLAAPEQITAILGDEQGVGKSAQAISAWELLGATKNLIICPGIARHNWLREINIWSTVPRKAVAIMGANLQAIDVESKPADATKADTIVVSDSLLRSINVLRFLIRGGRRWDTVIWDEAQRGKNEGAWRTRAVYGPDTDARRGISSTAKRMWLLSGTMMPRHPGELWTHCHALFPDVAKGRSYARWCEDYCRMDHTGKIFGAQKDAIPQLAERLHKHWLRRNASDVLPELPALRVTHIPVQPDKLPPMSTEVAETMMVVESAMRVLAAGNKDEAHRILMSAGEMHLATLRKWTGVALAPAVAEYLKMDLDSGLDKVVVFAEHRNVIAILEKLLPDAVALHGDVPVKKRQRILDGFQGLIPDYSPRCLVVNIEMASTAIPLTAACRCAFAEVPWVPTTVDQAIKRLRRKGQTRPVLAQLFSLAGSVHEAVISVLTRRAKEVMRLAQEISAEKDT